MVKSTIGVKCEGLDLFNYPEDIHVRKKMGLPFQ